MMRGWSGVCPWCGGGIGGGYSTTEMLIPGVFSLLILAGIVLLVVWIVRSTGPGRERGGAPPAAGMPHDEAVRIARERFARGEISKDELDQILKALGG